VANTGDDDPGYVGERLRQVGYTLDIAYRDKPDGLPATLDDYDVVVLLGSDWSTYWEHVATEVERESALVRHAHEAEIPLLAICYGAQLAAHALGGAVEPAALTEIGWFDLDVSSPNSGLVSQGPWFEFHSDRFTPPPAAQVLASTAAGPQAYRLGQMVGWQFHPEVTPEIVRRWGTGSRDQAARAAVDLAGVYAETDERAGRARDACHRLVDAFLTATGSAGDVTC
jgi:GMP synthase-like glutamine amidotransferase